MQSPSPSPADLELASRDRFRPLDIRQSLQVPRLSANANTTPKKAEAVSTNTLGRAPEPHIPVSRFNLFEHIKRTSTKGITISPRRL
jgi:hypothetical protein